MGAWICPTCRLHYGEEARQRCPADGATLVLNLSGASVQGHLLTHLLHVKPDGTTVWEAHAGPDERVALELLRGPQSAEAWAWAKGLDHPNIASVKGFAPIDDDLACAVMAWIDGEPLSERLAQGVMPVPTALHLADQILDALAYVHQQDGVHGDLQPATIFIEKGTDAKLINVGVHRWPPLAQVLGNGGAKALELSMVAYAAPERLAQGAADPAGDLYSLSALLWHLITGAPIFGSDPHACARAHLTAPRPALSATFPDRDWPEGLEAFLARGLAQRPEGRFASAEAMRTALRPIREATQRVPEAAPEGTDRPIPVVPMMVEPPVSSGQPPNRTWLWIAGVGVLLIGGVLIGNNLRDTTDSTRLATNFGPAGVVSQPVSQAKAQPASDVVENVRAIPLLAQPRTPESIAARAPVSQAAPPETALVANASEAPVSTALVSAAPVSAAPMSLAAPASVAPETAAVQVASVPAPVSAMPVSIAVAPSTAAPALELDPIQVASEPASPIARKTVAKAAPRARDAEATPKVVAGVRKTERSTRRKPVKKARKPRKKDRPVARVDDRAPKAAPLPTLGDKPTLPPSVSKHGIRILGQ